MAKTFDMAKIDSVKLVDVQATVRLGKIVILDRAATTAKFMLTHRRYQGKGSPGRYIPADEIPKYFQTEDGDPVNLTDLESATISQELIADIKATRPLPTVEEVKENPSPEILDSPGVAAGEVDPGIAEDVKEAIEEMGDSNEAELAKSIEAEVDPGNVEGPISTTGPEVELDLAEAFNPGDDNIAHGEDVEKAIDALTTLKESPVEAVAEAVAKPKKKRVRRTKAQIAEDKAKKEAEKAK